MAGPTDGTIDELKAHVSTLDDVAALGALKDAENAGKDRAGAHAVIDARIAELTPQDGVDADVDTPTLEQRVAAIEAALKLGDPTEIARRF